MSVTIANTLDSYSEVGGSSLLTGLFGYWKLDEVSGNAVDSTGSGYTGISSNITYNASGKISRCYTFNGSTSKVVIGNVIKPTTALSFSIWIKDGGQSTERHIIGHTIYDTDWRGWRFTRYNDGSAGVLMSAGSGTYLDVAFGSTYNNDAWHHVVFTWNGTTAYVYENGTKNAGWAWNNTISYGATHNLTFGANDSGGQVYDGEVDEIAIANRAWTDTEAGWLYNSGSGLAYPFS